jgi:hypothetical protein
LDRKGLVFQKRPGCFLAVGARIVSGQGVRFPRDDSGALRSTQNTSTDIRPPGAVKA